MNECEQFNKWEAADEAFARGQQSYLDWCRAIAALYAEGTATQEEIAGRYDTDQQRVSRAVAIGNDARVNTLSITSAPKDKVVLYYLTTLPDKDFEKLCKPTTTQAVILEHKKEVKAAEAAARAAKKMPSKEGEKEMKRYSWRNHAAVRGYLAQTANAKSVRKLKDECLAIDPRDDLFEESGKDALAAVFDILDERKKPQSQKDEEYKAHREEVKALPENAKQRFDRLVAKEVAFMRAAYEQEVRDAAKAFVPQLEEEYREKLALLKKRELNAKVLKDNVTVTLCMEDYRLLLNVLHPDKLPDNDSDRHDRFAKAFGIVKKLEPYVSAVRAREILWK